MNAIMAERTNRLASTWPPTTTGAAPPAYGAGHYAVNFDSN
jgi:hypothetical protein